MAPTKNTEKTEPAGQKDAEKPNLVTPDQRDTEIALLKEKLAAAEAQVEKLSERAQLAEMELEERGSSPKSAPTEDEFEKREMGRLEKIADLFASRLAIALGHGPKVAAKPKKRLTPAEAAKAAAEEFKGTEFEGARTYVVGPSRAFHNNRLYAAGEKITVVNQRPAKDWVPVEQAEVKKDLGATRTHVQPPTGRANDRSIA